MRFFDQGTKFFPRATTYGSVSRKILLEQTFYCLNQPLPGLRVSEIRLLSTLHLFQFWRGSCLAQQLCSYGGKTVMLAGSNGFTQGCFAWVLGPQFYYTVNVIPELWGCSEAWLMVGIWVFLQHCWLVRKLTAPLSSSYMDKYVHWSQDMGIKH